MFGVVTVTAACLFYRSVLCSIFFRPSVSHPLKACSHWPSQRYVDGRHLSSFWRKLWRAEWVAYPFACKRSIWWWCWRDGVGRCEQGFTLSVSTHGNITPSKMGCNPIRMWLHSSFSQRHKVGNVGINSNFVFPRIWSFLLYFDQVMLVNVKLDIKGCAKITY